MHIFHLVFFICCGKMQDSLLRTCVGRALRRECLLEGAEAVVQGLSGRAQVCSGGALLQTHHHCLQQLIQLFRRLFL